MLTELVDHAIAKEFIADWSKKLNDLLRTSFAFNPDNKEQYHAELKRATNRSKAIRIDLDLKNLRFKALEEKQKAKGESKGYTREYFQSVLITLSDHAKYQIQDSITVSEYCLRLQRFNSYCEQMQKHYKK